STFTAEAFAIRTALEILQGSYSKKEYNHENVIIFSDCQGVLKALKNNKLSVYHNRYIMEARELYWKIVTQFRIKIYLIWIPSHKGFIGNEIADILAKQGASERADDSIHVPFQDLTSVFKNEEWNDTQDRILTQARVKGQHYFSNYYKRSRKKSWFYGIQADRYFCTLINRIRANHYNLNASLARKEYIASAQCECGYDYEDIDHVVWSCDRYSRERESL
ncbi:hypothetical protein EAG_02388, partial [Camponotus floridanus]